MFRIGEFSKIAQVSSSQLRYYDEIGLFSPAHVDAESGYRLYSVAQLQELNRLIALKELGFTLKQVREMTGKTLSLGELRGMLEYRKAQIERTLQEDLMRLRTVESRLKALDDQVEHVDLVVKEVPETDFLCWRRTFPTLFDAVEAIWAIEEVVSASVPEKMRGPLGVVVHAQSFEMTDMDLELGVYLKEPWTGSVSLPSGQPLEIVRLPRWENAITTVRTGGPEDNHLCYGGLGRWLEDRELPLLQPGREVFLNPPRRGAPLEEVVCEVQFELPKSYQLTGV